MTSYRFVFKLTKTTESVHTSTLEADRDNALEAALSMIQRENKYDSDIQVELIGESSTEVFEVPFPSHIKAKPDEQKEQA